MSRQMNTHKQIVNASKTYVYLVILLFETDEHKQWLIIHQQIEVFESWYPNNGVDRDFSSASFAYRDLGIETVYGCLDHGPAFCLQSVFDHDHDAFGLVDFSNDACRDHGDLSCFATCCDCLRRVFRYLLDFSSTLFLLPHSQTSCFCQMNLETL